MCVVFTTNRKRKIVLCVQLFVYNSKSILYHLWTQLHDEPCPQKLTSLQIILRFPGGNLFLEQSTSCFSCFGHFEENDQNSSLKVLWIRKSSKRRFHFLNHFKYPLKLSHALSGLSGWENKGKHRGVFGQAVSATLIKDSHIPAIAKEPPFPLRRLARNPWQHGRHARTSMTNLVPG